MNGPILTREEVDAILKLVESAEHVSDFHLKYGDLELRFSRAPDRADAPPSVAVPATPAPRSVPLRSTPSAGEARAVPDGMLAVKSPMVGTVYRAPAPGARPFVEVGSLVDADAVVCIIEVMKLMNSVHAGAAGIVREIRVEDGQPVEFGQVLVVLEPR